MLRAACAALFFSLVVAGPSASGQEPGGDAPDGIGSAQPAYGTLSIFGDVETEGDVDCFAIFIEDPAGFSATTDNVGTTMSDTKLYVFEGNDVAGATTGIVMNDDCPGSCIHGSLLSNITPGSLPGPGGAGPGEYVLCLTEYDVDPLNSPGEDIWSNRSFRDILYPDAPSGDYDLVSWAPDLADDSGNYEITLTLTNDCNQELTATLDDDTPAPGQTITFSVSVSNTSPDRAPLDLWFVAKGPTQRTVRLGGGVVPGGGTVSEDVRFRVYDTTPPGVYNVNLYVGTFGGPVCDAVPFTVTVGSPPRETVTTAAVEKGAARPARGRAARWFDGEVVDAFVAGSASARVRSVKVSPNPFSRRANVSFDLADPVDIRLSVYDVLGREVAVLVDGRLAAGRHAVVFDAESLPAGTYAYRLVAGPHVETGRITLIR